MKINLSRRQGFTLVEIMIVVAIIGMLASIAVPNFVKARKTAQQKACISNLHQIDGAIQQWATDLNKGPNQTVSYTDIKDYLKNSVSCPSGGTSFDDSYTISTVEAVPTCQRFPTGDGAHALPTH